MTAARGGTVVTVTPNPSIDRTVEVPTLTRGAVLRATAHRVDPGGKGVNVSRVLARFGRPTLAVMPGGAGELADLLRAAGIQPVSTPARGATRVNTALVEADGTTTKVNEPGVELSAEEVAALVDTVGVHAAPAAWVVTAGSVPRGAPDDLHARVVTSARRGGARVAVDTSGPALAAAVAAGPDLVKPNVAELAELVGHPLPRLADVLAACADLRSGGVETVLVSMGAAGALVVAPEGAWHTASVPGVTVRSTVGAGDSTLAGYLLARTAPWPTHPASPADALVHAVACGAAAVGLPGTAVPGPDDVDTTSVKPASAPPESLDLTGEAT
ncbi:1-phosphofructokinase [Actinomycetospora cinnamomea]|uniref:1-phosphofructokinase n=1 Tax=Actinomycetospora cinnamomea TaxID=663609 RepID=A0A2U1F6R9_9PSEU|nr:1-phosphofructokinase [Actinomycetospora cinnamomea]PVZ07897.1 1-phosphofructokinase [Actinomycetospora cinnamomea]